jgi:Rubrerythrin
MKKFSNLTEREVLAVAIASEEEDCRIYMSFAENLTERYPQSARIFEQVAEEENGRRHMLIELYEQRFGPNLLPIRREDVKGFLRRHPIWLPRASSRGFSPLQGVVVWIFGEAEVTSVTPGLHVARKTANVLPIMREAQKASTRTLREIAEALNVPWSKYVAASADREVLDPGPRKHRRQSKLYHRMKPIEGAFGDGDSVEPLGELLMKLLPDGLKKLFAPAAALPAVLPRPPIPVVIPFMGDPPVVPPGAVEVCANALVPDNARAAASMIVVSLIRRFLCSRTRDCI